MGYLETVLSNCLPKDEQFELVHLQNTPSEVNPILTSINKDSDKVPKLTVKIPHFFALSHDKKIVFGLEIHVYLILWGNNNEYQKLERLFFVSKADSNGYCDIKFSAKAVTNGIISYLLSIDPDYYCKKIIPLERKFDKSKSKTLITKDTTLSHALKILSERQLTNIKNKIGYGDRKELHIKDYYLSLESPKDVTTKICLFTRPADQYLFAKSSKNPKKHTLDGGGLLKWWLSIIDDILCNYFEKTTEARLRIPGEDSITVRRYLREGKFQNWQVGDIFGGKSSSLAVFQIPLFSDDPKSRFLHELVEENRILKTNLETFWMELQERQEFKLSVSVSVMGVSGQIVRPLDLAPSEREVIVTKSKKQFKYIKNYITGEEYDTEEGSSEAYNNIVHYLKYRYDQKLLKICGSILHAPKKKEESKVQVITTLQPRKKTKI